MNKEQAEALRQRFESDKVGKLNTNWGKDAQYVSHAYVTDRLLSVDPEWTWEPVAFDERGLPAFDEHGGLWIKLTVCGVTRYGYGEPKGKNYHDRRKGAISNALVIAAMRFGVALDMWQKEEEHEEPAMDAEPKPVASDKQVAKWTAAIVAAKTESDLLRVGQDIGGYAMNDTTRLDLLATYNARKAELA